MLATRRAFLGGWILGAVAVVAACGGVGGRTGATTNYEEEKDPGEMLKVGTDAPDFAVEDQDGKLVRLSDYRGEKNVVLVFYPGDNTPVCTRQLCAIRDDWGRFQDADAVVFGVNPAGADSHRKFIDKNDYPFPILVDDEKEVISAYGCKGLFTKRTVYAIDRSGRIVFAERGRPSTDEILGALEGGPEK